MPLLSRERMLETLLDLCDRSRARTRPELVASALRGAILLTEAAGAAAVTGLGRRGMRSVLLPGEAQPASLDLIQGESNLARMIGLHAQPMQVPDLSADVRASEEDRCPGVTSGPALFAPIRLREQDRGYLAVYRPQGAQPFGTEDMRTLLLLAAYTTLGLENVRLAESVEKLAITDELTQVYNYRFLKTALRREVRRALRYRQDLSVIMIDVDNLKSYNDRFGHLRGSYLLREMAGLLAQQVRSWDLVAKYGGDEFTIILPQTPREGAMIAADRLRAAIEGHGFPLVPPGTITISLGVATLPADGDSGGSLIRAADRALYLAKRNGRNRIECAHREAA
jgi:diguanylate cyclase (GGDEF)-like protein